MQKPQGQSLKRTSTEACQDSVTDKAIAFCPMEHKRRQTSVKKIIQPSQEAETEFPSVTN